MENLNSRQELLLKALVESFISDGQPVGSTKLSKASDIGISSATIRNVFVDLEDLGYIYSPHKSAGRVPTELAYRMFVDKMIKVQPVNNKLIDKLKISLTEGVERKNIVKKTNEILSNMTELTGIISLPTRNKTELKQIDFLKLSDNKILAILINKNNDVEIFHYSNEGQCSWYDFAKAIFEILQKQINSKRLIIFATHNRFFAKKSDFILEMVDGNIKSSNG